MARRKRSTKTQREMQELVLTYSFAPNEMGVVKYIDLGQSASKVNRKLFRQGFIYEIESVQLVNANAPITTCMIATLPCNWVTRNAWTKAFALWQQMNLKVLQDNPSVVGKWHDFKCFFDGAHATGGSNAFGPTLNKHPVDGDLTEVFAGEWVMSKYVLPQPNVDPTTGEPLAADDFTIHILGDDVGGPLPAVLTSGGAIKMYEDTRARVDASPTVPGDMSISWGTQLTDDGSQEPELADIIESANDVPPYDEDDYPGGDGNYDGGNLAVVMYLNGSNASDWAFNLKAPLGLLKIAISQATKAGSEVAGATLIVKLRPGHYNGLSATQMSQGKLPKVKQ